MRKERGEIKQKQLSHTEQSTDNNINMLIKGNRKINK